MKKTAVTLCACALLLAGCGGSGGSDQPTSTGGGVTVDIAIKDGKVTPQGRRVEVKVGQKVTLHVTSDAQEEVHVHSELEHEYEITPVTTSRSASA